MITKDQIIEKLKAVEFSAPGSGLGSVYHQLPFNEFNEFSPRRLSNENRLDMMLKHCDFHGKKVLDIGCNVGYFTFKLAEQGAVCYGLDYDPEAIQIANMLKSYRNVQNAHFLHGHFEKRTLEKLLNDAGKFDVILILSVIHWLLYKYNDIDRIISLLRMLTSDKQVIFYEPSTSKRAFYPEMLKKRNVYYFLKNLGCKSIDSIGKSRPENAGLERTIWIGQIDYPAIAKDIYDVLPDNGKRSKNRIQKTFFSRLFKRQFIKILSFKGKGGCVIYDNFFVKVRNLKHLMIFTSANEIDFSRFLNGKDFVPHYYYHLDYKEYRFIFYENTGLRSLDSWTKKLFLLRPLNAPLLEKKLFHILSELRKEKIIHRDIHPPNILLDKKINRLYLVDYELASFEGSEIQTNDLVEKQELQKRLQTAYGEYGIPDMPSSFEKDAYITRRIIKKIKTMTFPNILLSGVLNTLVQRSKRFFPDNLVQRLGRTFLGTWIKQLKNRY